MMRNCLCVISCFFTVIAMHAQSITRSVYDKAASLRMTRLNNKTIFNLSVQPEWNSDSSGFSFARQSKEGKTFMQYDFKAKKVLPLVEQEKLTRLISELLKKELKTGELPVTSMRFKDKDHLVAIIDGKSYTLDLRNDTFTELKDSIPNEMETISPDGNWIAYTQQFNLYIRSVKTGEVKQLSQDGKKDYLDNVDT
ncbi:MAG: hypothetical protein EOO02_19795, partial [Chitinophagaceae bacterium]